MTTSTETERPAARARSSRCYTAPGLARLDLTTLHRFHEELTLELERVTSAIGLRSAEIRRKETTS